MRALKSVENSPWVFFEIAKFFHSEQKYDKAIKFIRQAIVIDKDLGDCWALYFKLISMSKSEEIIHKREELLKTIV